MEKAENGSSQPALSTDVNEKGTSTSLHRLSAATTTSAAHLFNVNNGDETGWSASSESGEVDVGRPTSVDRSALPQSVRVGTTKMLDLVTEISPAGTVNKCVVSEPCSDSSNRLTETAQARSMGTDRALSSSLIVNEDREEMDVDALQGLSLAEQSKDFSAEDPDGHQSQLNGQHQHSCTHTASPRTGPEGLSNGDVDCGTQYNLSGDAGTNAVMLFQPDHNQTTDKEVKVANGGLLIGQSSRATLYTDSGAVLPTHSDGADTCPSNPPQLEMLSASAARDIHSQEPCCAREEPDITGDQPRTQASEEHLPDNPNIPSQGVDRPSRPTRAGATRSPEPATRQAGENASDLGLSSSISPRPLALRTMPNSISYNSAPLSPEDDEMFLEATGGHCELRFMDVSLSSRNTYESSRRQSAPGDIPEALSVVESSELALQSKKPGIAEYFGRSLFSKKQRDHSVPGWKLFGKVPLRESPSKDSRTIQQESNPGSLTSVSTPNLLSAGEYEAKAGKATEGTSPTQPQGGRRRNLEFEPLSTTALILEDRPANLPAKSVEEAQRHRQEYDEMVAEAKKRELKEAQRKKKQMKERFKQEESIANAMVVWNNDILPNWESMRNTRRVRELWWQGLPPNVRGKVWSLAVGNELNITSELYEIFLSRAKERWKSFSETGSESEADDGASLADRESSLDLIKLDISRTFPPLYIFQKGGPYHDLLHSVLGAYTCYRPDVGYVQGMSFIAAVLILNLEEADAFIAFANLLNKPCQLAFFRVDHDLMLKYFAAFEVFFEENLPLLFNHFQSSNLTPDLYLIDWIFTLYSKSLPLDVACRVWDVFCRDGEEFLFRTGLGILRLYEEVLLQMDFIHSAQFLTRLPEDIGSDRLFSCIAATPMLASGNRKWTQVFSALIKDNKEMEKNTNPALKSSGFTCS